MSYSIIITPRDPLVARDGRPFGTGQGARMKSLDWFYPSVVVGSLRSLLGKRDANAFEASNIASLKKLRCRGPFPVFDHELFFPAPRDLQVWLDDEGHRRYAKLRPLKTSTETACCDLPGNGLHPIAIGADAKPAKAVPWWSRTRIASWLCDALVEPPDDADPVTGFWSGPEKDVRTHVAIETSTGVAEEGKLFQSVGLDLAMRTPPYANVLALHIDQSGVWANHLSGLDALHPMGGERRLAHWSRTEGIDWGCPENLTARLAGAKRVCMLLATPGYFRHGWRPDWIDEQTLIGQLPGTVVRLKLVSACIGRWVAVSGWSLERKSFGPKPVKRLVPAGSVYFFKVESGTAQDLASRWLQPVGDDPDMNNDGYGLALWGVWEEQTHGRL